MATIEELSKTGDFTLSDISSTLSEIKKAAQSILGTQREEVARQKRRDRDFEMETEELRSELIKDTNSLEYKIAKVKSDLLRIKEGNSEDSYRRSRYEDDDAPKSLLSWILKGDGYRNRGLVGKITDLLPYGVTGKIDELREGYKKLSDMAKIRRGYVRDYNGNLIKAGEEEQAKRTELEMLLKEKERKDKIAEAEERYLDLQAKREKLLRRLTNAGFEFENGQFNLKGQNKLISKDGTDNSKAFIKHFQNTQNEMLSFLKEKLSGNGFHFDAKSGKWIREKAGDANRTWEENKQIDELIESIKSLDSKFDVKEEKGIMATLKAFRLLPKELTPAILTFKGLAMAVGPVMAGFLTLGAAAAVGTSAFLLFKKKGEEWNEKHQAGIKLEKGKETIKDAAKDALGMGSQSTKDKMHEDKKGEYTSIKDRVTLADFELREFKERNKGINPKRIEEQKQILKDYYNITDEQWNQYLADEAAIRESSLLDRGIAKLTGYRSFADWWSGNKDGKYASRIVKKEKEELSERNKLIEDSAIQKEAETAAFKENMRKNAGTNIVAPNNSTTIHHHHSGSSTANIRNQDGTLNNLMDSTMVATMYP